MELDKFLIEPDIILDIILHTCHQKNKKKPTMNFVIMQDWV